MTREEVIAALETRLYEHFYSDYEDINPYYYENAAKEILDWLDEIGYYNMHFYGVATKNVTLPKEPRKE
jgi:hypothetical protein